MAYHCEASSLSENPFDTRKPSSFNNLSDARLGDGTSWEKTGDAREIKGRGLPQPCRKYGSSTVNTTRVVKSGMTWVHFGTMGHTRSVSHQSPFTTPTV